ncbi:MAG: M1 family metallopeptidase, partial [Acidimicrobiia bacterium]
MASEADYRLPRTVIPSHYDISIEPDLDAATFAGSVIIDVDIVEPVTEIILNANELDIENVSLRSEAGEVAPTFSLDAETERLALAFESPVAAGAAKISITFTGILNDDLHGFYRSTYTTADGESETIATTQFEATDARRAFPCWDEPDLKATYAVELIVEEGLLAISNAAEVGRVAAGPGKVKVSFARTMRMSTYLVAFVVGELEATEPLDVDGTPLRIIATPDNAHLTSFALEMGAHSLRYFADYYGIVYPGDKLDMIAIPDFAWGAMENLGCITYRETVLLLDEASATSNEKILVADVIAHEIAHMWFGDLVTMKWWNGIWLNEAFATFAQTKCVDAFEPEWDRWLSFSAGRAASQETDALEATRSIEMEVASPDEATAMFDVLTYQKGSSVLRMLEQYIGEDAFRAGVTRYLKTHAYGNTETTDLWDALDAESGEPVGEIMDTWIFQGGYPTIGVERVGTDLILRQGQFRLIGEGDGTWKVPVLYRTPDGDGKTLVGASDVTLGDVHSAVVNAGGEGFYRVSYSDELRTELLDRMSDLSAIERYALVSDSVANLLRGDLSGVDYLTLVASLSDEDDKDVWSVAISGISELDRVISSDDRPALQEFVVDLLSDKADVLGWHAESDESDRTKTLRALMLKTLGVLGADPESVVTARALFVDLGTTGPDVADAALAIVAANGDADTFSELIARSNAATTPQLKVKHLRAATQVADPQSAADMFYMVINGEIRAQDSYWVLALLLGHRQNGPRIWELIMENWDAVLDAMPPQNRRRLLDLIQYRSEPDVAESIVNWFQDHTIAGGEAFTSQQLELLAVRVGLREREG